jgi:hypothetical protein
MTSRRAWCDLCRGPADGPSDLFKCASCPRRFHAECCDKAKNADNGWECAACREAAGGDGDDDDRKAAKTVARKAKAATKAVRAAHSDLRDRSAAFFKREKKALAPFLPAERLAKLTAVTAGAPSSARATTTPLTIGPHEGYVNANLRPYQVAGVNWALRQFAAGTGGILADEMGLGKTIQTLAFLACLKANGHPGPHLVVTPLAVLQNWHNEIKRFTPGLSVVKIQGSVSERDRVLSMGNVLAAQFDVYLTTYETVNVAHFCRAASASCHLGLC